MRFDAAEILPANAPPPVSPLKARDDDLDAAFMRYVERRYARCKLVVESSVQIGEWQLRPTKDMDQPGLTQRVIEAMIQPI